MGFGFPHSPLFITVGGEYMLRKRAWIISFAVCALCLLADGILFCVALASPTWKGPWGRYLFKAFGIGAAVFGALGIVLMMVYLFWLERQKQTNS